MSAQPTFTILFWIKKNQIKKRMAPLYARITIDGKRAEIATHRKVSSFDWNPDSQMLSSKTQEAKETNNYLAIMKAKLLNCQSKLEARGIAITSEAVKNEFIGVVEKPKMLLQVIQQHNDDIKTLIGKDYSKATCIKYCTTLKHIQEFLKWKYNLLDISLVQLNFEFITDFEFYLKSPKKN